MPENLSPEAQAAANQAVVEILSNPENEKTHGDLFKAAREQGILKDGKLVIEEQKQEDPVLKTIQARFGNYESTEDFFAEVDKWKNGGATLDVFKTLPEPLYKAIDAHLKGSDWTQAIRGEALIDFSRDYTDEQLLSFYPPAVSLTYEELADAENPAAKIAKNNAKKAFLIQKQEKANEKQLNITRANQAERHLKESVDSTIADFKNIYKLTATQETRLRNELLNGTFQTKFLDGKGGFNIDAASNLFPLIYPQEYRSIVSSKSEDKATQEQIDLLNRGKDPREFKRSPVIATDKQEQLKRLAETFTQGDKTPFKLKQV